MNIRIKINLLLVEKTEWATIKIRVKDPSGSHVSFFNEIQGHISKKGYNYYVYIYKFSWLNFRFM